MGGEPLARHLHRVAGPQRRLLADEVDAAAGEGGLDRVGLVADDDRDGIGPSGLDRAQHVLEEGHAQRRVQHLGPRALHARAVAGGQDHGLRASTHADRRC